MFTWGPNSLATPLLQATGEKKKHQFIQMIEQGTVASDRPSKLSFDSSFPR